MNPAALRIAHIATVYQSVVTILDSKLRALDKFDDVDVMAISSPPEIGEQRKPSVAYIPLYMARSIKPLADLKSIWQLYKILKKGKYDIAHSHTSKAGFISAIAGRIAGVPLIIHTHHGFSFYEGQHILKYHFNRLLEKIVCKLRHHTFTQSRSGIPKSIELIGSRDKVSFEGNGVDIDFVSTSAEKNLAQGEKDFYGTGLKIALVCRLEPVKRVSDFIEVVHKLVRDGIQVSCVIAGEGKLRDMLTEQIKDLSLEDKINLIGFTNRVHGIIAASDIVVLNSEKEGIPRVLMEAMALRKAVVATDVEGTNELVVNAETGFLVPLSDPAAMAEKIKIVAGNSELREKMGIRGFERVCEHFNDVKIAKLLHDFYVSWLGNKR